MTHEDVCRCFHGDTMLTVQAPSGTQLEVPIPDSVCIDFDFSVFANCYLICVA